MVKWILNCPECGDELSLMGYFDDDYRYEGHCSNCSKYFDIRIGKGEAK